jgi:hypothetical protein
MTSTGTTAVLETEAGTTVDCEITAAFWINPKVSDAEGARLWESGVTITYPVLSGVCSTSGIVLGGFIWTLSLTFLTVNVSRNEAVPDGVVMKIVFGPTGALDATETDAATFVSVPLGRRAAVTPEPLKMMDDVALRFVPVILSERTVPGTADAGSNPVNDAKGGSIVSVSTFERFPDPTGLRTWTGKEPAAASELADIVPVNFAELTNIVGTVNPFTTRDAPLTKLLPIAVTVRSVDPTITELGSSSVRTGMVTSGGGGKVVDATKTGPLFRSRSVILSAEPPGAVAATGILYPPAVPTKVGCCSTRLVDGALA